MLSSKSGNAPINHQSSAHDKLSSDRLKESEIQRSQKIKATSEHKIARISKKDLQFSHSSTHQEHQAKLVQMQNEKNRRRRQFVQSAQDSNVGQSSVNFVHQTRKSKNLKTLFDSGNIQEFYSDTSFQSQCSRQLNQIYYSENSQEEMNRREPKPKKSTNENKLINYFSQTKIVQKFQAKRKKSRKNLNEVQGNHSDKISHQPKKRSRSCQFHPKLESLLSLQNFNQGKKSQATIQSNLQNQPKSNGNQNSFEYPIHGPNMSGHQDNSFDRIQYFHHREKAPFSENQHKIDINLQDYLIREANNFSPSTLNALLVLFQNQISSRVKLLGIMAIMNTYNVAKIVYNQKDVRFHQILTNILVLASFILFVFLELHSIQKQTKLKESLHQDMLNPKKHQEYRNLIDQKSEAKYTLVKFILFNVPIIYQECFNQGKQIDQENYDSKVPNTVSFLNQMIVVCYVALNCQDGMKIMSVFSINLSQIVHIYMFSQNLQFKQWVEIVLMQLLYCVICQILVETFKQNLQITLTQVLSQNTEILMNSKNSFEPFESNQQSPSPNVSIPEDQKKSSENENSSDTMIVNRKHKIDRNNSLSKLLFSSSDVYLKQEISGQLKSYQSTQQNLKYSEQSFSSQLFQDQMMVDRQAFLCKLNRVKRYRNSDHTQSKIDLSHKGVPKQFKQKTGKGSLDVEILQISNRFFDKLPFYNQVSKIVRRYQMNNITLHQSENISYQLNKKSHYYLTDFRQHISQVDQEMLNLSIFEPYFINNSTIIHFSNNKRQIQHKPQLLSIQNILDNYADQKTRKSKLYFKVDSHTKILSKLAHLQNAQNPNAPANLGQKNNSQDQLKKTVDSLNQVKRSKQENQTFQTNEKPQIRDSNQIQYLKNSIDYQIDEEQKVPATQNSQEKYDQLSQSFKSKRGRKNLSLDSNKSSSLINDEFHVESFHDKNYQQFNYDDESISSSVLSNLSNFTSQKFPQTPLNKKKEPIINDEAKMYFEIEIQQLTCKKAQSQDDIFVLNSQKQNENNTYTFFQIKDVTQLVKYQQKFSDIVYQEAIENNYSHEQMTPLQPIIAFSSILKKKLIELYAKKLNIQIEYPLNHISYQNVILKKIVKKSIEAQQSMQQIISIEQSAKSVLYYSSNQIARMKIQKDQLVIQEKPCRDIGVHLSNVIWPFEFQIYKRTLNVYVFKKQQFDFTMYSDWSLYEYILFNIVQNAVKYNKPMDGDIFIILSCKPMRNKEAIQKDSRQMKSFSEYYDSATNVNMKCLNYVLETQVIDTGEGISPEKQDLLFIPFLELKNFQGVRREHYDNIGLGLACSSQIVKAMGGDIKLIESRMGFTNISFKIPIKLKKQNQQDSDSFEALRIRSRGSISMFENDSNQSKHFKRIQIIGQQRRIPQQIRNYLAKNQILSNNSEIYHQEESRNQSCNSCMLNSDIFLSNIQKIGFQQLGRHGSNQSVRGRNGGNGGNGSHSRGYSLEQHQSQNQQNKSGNSSFPRYSSKNSTHLKKKENIKQIQSNTQSQQQNQNPQSDQSRQVNRRPHEGKFEARALFVRNFIPIEKANVVMFKSNQKSAQISSQDKEQLRPLQSERNSNRLEPSSLIVEQDHEERKISRHPRFYQQIQNQIYTSDSESFLLKSNESNHQFDPNNPENQRKEQQQRNELSKSDVIDSQLKKPSNQKINKSHIQRYKRLSDNKIFDLNNNIKIPEHRIHRSYKYQSDCKAQNQSILHQVDQMDQQMIESLPRNLKKAMCHNILVNNSLNPMQRIVKRKFNEKNQLNNENTFNENAFDDNINEPIYDVFISQSQIRRFNNEMKMLRNSEEHSPNISFSIDSSNSSCQIKPRIIQEEEKVANNDNNGQKLSRTIESQMSSRLKSSSYQQNSSSSYQIENFVIGSDIEEQKVSNSRLNNDSSFYIESQINLSKGSEPYVQLPNDQLEFKDKKLIDIRIKQQSDNKVNQKEQIQRQRNQQSRRQIIDSNSSVSNSSNSSKGLVSKQIREKKSVIHQSLMSKSKQQILGNVSEFSDSYCDCNAKILIVDDNQFNILTLVQMIQSQYQMIQIEEALNGKIAVQKFKQAFEKECGCINRAYKLVFMDIQMPGMDGYETTIEIMNIIRQEQLRQNQIRGERLNDLVEYHSIVSLTSFTGKNVGERCRNVGMKMTLQKPLKFTLLDEVLQKYYYQVDQQ